MADPSVTGEQLLDRVETYHRRVAELTRQMKEHPERLSQISDGLQVLIDHKRSNLEPPADGLPEYYGIRDLYVIGPDEWGKAVRGEKRGNRNPLGLAQNWCPCPPVPYTVEQMRALVELCKTPDWATRVVLFLALPEVGGVPTSLIGQRELWGVPHDGIGSGRVCSNIFWSDWFAKDAPSWALEPAVTKPAWFVGYELLKWTIMHSWDDQQRLASDRGMSIMSVARSVLMRCLLAINGVQFNEQTWMRTATSHDGYPLSVHWYSGNGLYVSQYWHPELANGFLGVSVEGVPRELDL